MEESNSQSHPPKFLVISPLDWAVAFARGSFSAVVPLLLLVVSLQAGLVYLRFTKSLSSNHYFLIGIAETLLTVWFITTLVYLSISLFKKEKPELFVVALQAFSQIPKVFFSYVCILMIVGIALVSLQGMTLSSEVPPAFVFFLSLPLLIVSAYLLWAPLFCAAEGMAIVKKEKEEVDLDELDEDELLERAQQRFQKQFSEKMPWELGFARSVKLSGLNVSLTYTAVLLLATAHFLPLSVISFLFPPGLLRSIVEIVAVGGLNAFVLLVICGAFLVLLAKEAKDELGISYYLDPRSFLKNDKLPQVLFQGGKLTYVVLILVCAVSFSVVFKDTLESHTVPKNLQVVVKEERTSSGGFYTLVVELADKDKLFQWYRADGFRLTLGAEVEGKKGESFEPLEVLTLNDKGEASDELVFAPRTKPVTVRIVFKIPKETLLQDTPWKLQFADLFGENVELLAGKVSQEPQ